MENAAKILVCPLNWGLGHASRCVPIIRHLLQQGKQVIIASDGFPLELLKSEFPQLSFIHFPSYKVRYKKGKSQVLAMVISLPSIIRGIYKEHQQLKKIITDYGIDGVLSDNRFGLWNKKIRSIYMTHQLMVKMPKHLKWLEPVAWRMHRFFIQKYSICLIPDKFEDGGFAGDLTHKYPLPENAKFIGILSRFGMTSSYPVNKEPYKVLAVLSGLEPQRTLFENILVEELAKKDIDSLIIQGLPENEQKIRKENRVTVVSHLSSEEIKQYMLETPTIICRSGYSTVMDLVTLNLSAIFVPTPGQTEQEYLAEYLSGKGLFTSVEQTDLKEFIAKEII